MTKVISLAVSIPHLFIMLISSLKLSRNVEINLGPHKIIKLVQGSFNQGTLALFEENGGKQCACSVFLSLCWSVVCDICYWKSVDINCVLTEGDKLYKSLK